MKAIAEKLNNYKNEKITVFCFSEFGFPILIRAKLISAEDKPFAQYNNSLYVVMTPKGKLKPIAKRFLNYQNFAIFDGWYDFDLNANNIIQKQGYTIKESKYPCFDVRYYVDALMLFSANKAKCIYKHEV